MKALLTLWLVLAALLSPAQTVKSLERISLSGVEYVRMREWAAICGLKLQQKTDKIFEANGSSTKLVFTLNSTRSEIKGLIVLLSMPIQERGGVPLISLIDLHSTVHPILYPPKNDSKTRVRTVCLDPGHGGRDTGEIDGRHQEKKYNLLLAEEMGRLLKRAGLKVVMTRTRDQTLDLSDRPVLARRHGADLFVSLHYNSAPNSGVSGAEVYCMSPPGANSSNEGGGKAPRQVFTGNNQNDRNVLLGYLIQKSMVQTAGLEDRGLKRSRFAVLRDASMPAVLVEAGFMSNREEARNIYNATFRKKMAQAIVDGILNYKTVVERN